MNFHPLGFGQRPKFLENSRLGIGEINRAIASWLHGKEDQIGEPLVGQGIDDPGTVMGKVSDYLGWFPFGQKGEAEAQEKR